MSDEAVQAAEASEGQNPAEEVKQPVPEAAAVETPTPVEAAAPAVDSAPVAETPAPAAEAPAEPEDVSYQAVEKEGTVTAIWEMQGQKHLRTIDPRSIEGKQILALFETAG
jgi:outer membrane biosynthesis protein TonB